MNLQGVNFIAVDFETAGPSQMACQVGFTIVKDGEIKETITRLIQPPGNQYDKNCIRTHHITPDKTQNEPTFDVVWQDISHYFIETQIVAHNRGTDENVLLKNLEYYGIMSMGIRLPFTCTYKLLKYGLEDLCVGFNMDYSGHHDAGFDSMCCAQFYINYLSGIKPDEELIKQHQKERKNGSLNNIFSSHEKICGDVLKKDLTGADPCNPFYDRKVVITGTFSFDRRSLARKLQSMGADVDSGITKKTNFVIIGDDAGPSKMEKLEKLIHDGYKIKKIYEEDLDRIFSGDFEDFVTEKQVRKDLDFTYNHFLANHIGWIDPYNIEMFWGKDFKEQRFCIYQITGNMGALGNWELCPEVQICVLSNTTIEKLKNGVKDETIQYIQDYYNRNKAMAFNFKFITEDDILSYCSENYESLDPSTKKYYDTYVHG